jgi:alpha-beta hydrolase superfamily lysophospholipase
VAGAESHFAEINGMRMHYVALGSGPVVMLLHGWPQTSFAWHGVMPRLAERFTVVAPELRGTGRSERTEGGYDKRTIAEDVRALIAHAGESGRLVIGHTGKGGAQIVSNLTSVQRRLKLFCRAWSGGFVAWRSSSLE